MIRAVHSSLLKIIDDPVIDEIRMASAQGFKVAARSAPVSACQGS